jgi:hypothetical protein
MAFPAVSSALVITASWPWFALIVPVTLPVGGVEGVGAGSGLVVGAVGELEPFPLSLQPVMVIVTPLRMASTDCSVKSRLVIGLSFVMLSSPLELELPGSTLATDVPVYASENAPFSASIDAIGLRAA